MAGHRLTPKAQQDIWDIGDFIALDNPVRALSFTRELRAKITETAENPLIYRERSELRAGIRAVRHGRYLIFYRIDGDTMVVTRVIHASRELASFVQQ